ALAAAEKAVREGVERLVVLEREGETEGRAAREAEGRQHLAQREAKTDEAVSLIEKLGRVVCEAHKADEAARQAMSAAGITLPSVDVVTGAITSGLLEAGVLGSRDLTAPLTTLRQLARERQREKDDRSVEQKKA